MKKFRKILSVILAVFMIGSVAVLASGCAVSAGKYYLYNPLTASYNDNTYYSVAGNTATHVTTVGSSTVKTKYKIVKEDKKVYFVNDDGGKTLVTVSEDGKTLTILLLQYKKK